MALSHDGVELSPWDVAVVLEDVAVLVFVLLGESEVPEGVDSDAFGSEGLGGFEESEQSLADDGGSDERDFEGLVFGSAGEFGFEGGDVGAVLDGQGFVWADAYVDEGLSGVIASDEEGVCEFVLSFVGFDGFLGIAFFGEVFGVDAEAFHVLLDESGGGSSVADVLVEDGDDA